MCKYHIYKFIFIGFVIFLASCEDPVDVEAGQSTPYYSIDGVITTLQEDQSIKVIRAGNYFIENSIEFIEDAEVKIVDDSGKEYIFDHFQDGEYILLSNESDFNDQHEYSLFVTIGSNTFTSTSELYRVPEISSITWTTEDLPFGDIDEFTLAEFYATDFNGAGDRYWARGFKNDSLINKDDFSIAWDWSPGSAEIDTSGIFATPIRQVITPFSFEEEELIKIGDKLSVKLLAIDDEFIQFLTILDQQINSIGGLFATPPANVPTNISNLNPDGEICLGWFQVCNTSYGEAIIDSPEGRVDFE